MAKESGAVGHPFLGWLATLDYVGTEIDDVQLLQDFVRAKRYNTVSSIPAEHMRSILQNLAHCLHDALVNRNVPLKLRREAIRSLPWLFEMCSRNGDGYSHELYYFWDFLDISDPNLHEDVLRSQELQLEIDNTYVRSAALFGLRESRFMDSTRNDILQRFLARPDVNPANRAEAEYIALNELQPSK